MDYELCKKLKDAGFPQLSDVTMLTPGKYKVDLGMYGLSKEQLYLLRGIKEEDVLSLEEYKKLIVCVPTLSELMEACGEGINRLWRVDQNYDGGESKWCATGKNDFLDGLGKTPEEAVANLWLALNNK